MRKSPKRIKDTIEMEVIPGLKITLFPKMEPGQPEIDIVRVDFTQIEGDTRSICMTPTEAIDLSGGLMSAVQMYLFNQKQYRKEILTPQLRIVKKRQQNAKNRKFG